MNSGVKNKKTYLRLTLFAILIGCLTNVYRFYKNNTHFEVQDWLINYQAGFVRRGLTGELFHNLSEIFNVEIRFFYLLFLYIILICFFYLVYDLLKNIKFTLINILIIFCPLSIIYNVLDAKSTGRKEILFLLFFLFFLNFIDKIRRKENSVLLITILSPLLLLMHEGVLFFLPYFYSIIFIYINSENKKKIYLYSIFFTLIIMFTTFFLFTSGATLDQVSIICDSLGSSSRIDCLEGGAIVELSRNLNIAFEDVKNRNLYGIWNGFLKISIIGFMLTFIPILISIFFLQKRNINFNPNNSLLRIFPFQFVLFVPLVFTLPLYFFTLDWGRWIHTSYTLTMFCFVFYIKKGFLLEIDSGLRINNFLSNTNEYLKRFLFALIIIIYCLGWYLPYCCNTKIQFPIIKSIKNITRVLN